MRCVLAVLLLHLASGTMADVNYCSARMCGHTNAHTFCQYPLGPSPSCIGYIDAHLSAEEKASVLARLNRRRAEVASGVRNWPPAGNMMKLRWVEELSREAQRWADQCRPPATVDERDACRDLYSIKVGQCVASVVGEAPGLRPESMIDMWYMQKMYYIANVTYYTFSNKHYYGDFAQMIWSRAFMVGCGRSRFMTSWRGRLRSVERLVCNFAPRGPSVAKPLWIPAMPATACPRRSRQDTEMPTLCDYQNNIPESDDRRNTIPFEDNLLLNTIFEIENSHSLDYLGSIDKIYLTKLAVATIENTVTVPIYKQKRDITENNGLEDKQLNITEINIGDSLLKNNLGVNVKPLIRNVKLIGRPKAYGIEELSSIGDNNNINEISKDNVIEKMDLYVEYDLAGLQENNTSSNDSYNNGNINETLIIENTEKNGENQQIKVNSEDIMENTNLFEIPALLNHSVSSNIFHLDGVQAKKEVLNDKVEDYFSDSETVQELQEALDRMEHTLAEPTVTAGKVRRELRPANYNFSELNAPTEDSGTETNKSIARGPMLNMVLRYLPYLKPYEQSIVGDVSSASSIKPSVFFILVVFFNFHSSGICVII